MYLRGVRYTFDLCAKVSNNYCGMSDLILGNVFCPTPKYMIRLLVEYCQVSKIPIRPWKPLVEDTPFKSLIWTNLKPIFLNIFYVFAT